MEKWFLRSFIALLICAGLAQVVDPVGWQCEPILRTFHKSGVLAGWQCELIAASLLHIHKASLASSGHQKVRYPIR